MGVIEVNVTLNHVTIEILQSLFFTNTLSITNGHLRNNYVHNVTKLYQIKMFIKNSHKQ